MTNRFDLETQIMQCWNVVDDLDYVQELVQDDDQASNVVLGLKELYKLKFEKCFEVFENYIKNERPCSFTVKQAWPFDELKVNLQPGTFSEEESVYTPKQAWPF